MNASLTVFVEDKVDISITNLNTIHYIAAIYLAGTVTPPTQTERNTFDPDEAIKNKITKVRKWIGKLTATVNGKMKLTPKVKRFIKTQTITSVIVTLKMKLAALAKGLKAKTETRDRFRNNKLYRCKKRHFMHRLEQKLAEGRRSPIRPQKKT